MNGNSQKTDSLLFQACANQLDIECDALHMTAIVHPKVQSVLKIQMDDLKELHFIIILTTIREPVTPILTLSLSLSCQVAFVKPYIYFHNDY